MMRPAFSARLAALGLACAFAALPLAARADSLHDARAAVDVRQFDVALPLFEALLAKDPGNADLLIETARVYGFADRHAEAIAIYRRVLEVAPARRYDVLGAMAWQMLWSGDAAGALPNFVEAQAHARDDKERAELLRGEAEAHADLGDLRASIVAYQQALLLRPEDRDLQRRIALTWLWLDDYAQAEAAWRALLASDPNDRRSQAGLARTLNAGGRHNAAIRAYEGLDDGSDPDVRLDHARALYWAGYPAPAYDLLAGRNDAGAVWLRDWRIERERLAYVYGTAEYATDADGLDVASVAAATGRWLTPSLLGEVGYRYVNLNDDNGSVNGNRLFATLRGVYGEPGVTPPGLLVPSVSIGLNDYDGWSPVTGNASLRWMPVDLWRIAADLGREIVETPLAVENRITVDSASLGVETRLPPHWELAGAVSYLRFSDDNSRTRINGSVGYAVRFNPKVVVGVEGAAFEDSAPASFAPVPPPGTIAPHGYWNPKRYAEGRVFAGIWGENQPWEWYGRVALGTSRETDADGNTTTGTPNLLEVGVAYDVGPRLRWRAFAGGSGSSFAVGNGGSGYWRRYVGINLTAWFK
ncbi:MAG: tetratricopeptide repeat protein [Burkholderiaceae bacterium]|nr:tetratricopeptide repeat protein [Burkholderiaceae bacterium]